MSPSSQSVFQYGISLIYVLTASINGTNLPWTWDSPPLWALIESRDLPVFTDYEYQFMTDTYDIIGLGACFDNVNGDTESRWFSAATGIRQYSPSSDDTKILFYWPVPGAYTDCWLAAKPVAQNSSMWLYDDNGNLMGSTARPQIDMTQEYVRNWWVNAIVSIIQNALSQNIIVDGVFLDGVKTWLVGVSQDRRDAYDAGQKLALTKLREEFNKIDPNLFILGLGIGVLMGQVDGTDTIPYIDGVCLEQYGAFNQIDVGTGMVNPDWLLTWNTVINDIMNGVYGADKKVFIKAWPGPVSAPLEALWGPSWPSAFGTRPDTYLGIAQASADLLAFPLASYLCGMYQQGTYFSYTWWWAKHNGWIPCPDDPTSCMAPTGWYPELTTLLGQPLGDGLFTNTYECTRSFENADIYVDLRDYTTAVIDFHVTDAPTAAPTFSPTIYEPYEIILRQKPDFYFTNPSLENEDNSQANTYSIIDTFDETKKNLYKGPDNKWQFRLVYTYSDDSEDILIWKQSSWLLEGTITGYEEISVPIQTFADTTPQYFRGLGLNVVFAGYSLLDGDGTLNDDAWNCVGTKRAFSNGIVAFNGKIAAAATLYIFDAWGTNYPTSPPVTQQPTDSPSTKPTDTPITPMQTMYQLILNNKPDYYFSTPSLENQNDPNANTYSIIDNIDETSNIYKGPDNKYEFKLIYGYSDNSQDVIIWKQSSWLLEGTIIGYEPISMPTQNYGTNNPAYFRGLGLNEKYPNFALLDGDGTYFDNAYNCVGQKRAWTDTNTGESGILAFNAKIAKTEALYIRDFTTNNPTTSTPTSVSPTTNNPTTTIPTTIQPSTMVPTSMRPTTTNPTANPTTVSPTQTITTSPDTTSESTAALTTSSESTMYQLILDNKPDYYFSTPSLENTNDPNANTYSIIDAIDETSNIYVGTDGKYEFKLIYDGYSDNSQDIIIWKQSSWLLEGTIIGYESISIPTQIYPETNPAYFRGLGLNVAFPNFALLDGDGTYFDNAYNCVGQKRAWNDANTGESGILAFNAKIAKTSTLYIRDFTTNNHTTSTTTTNNPTTTYTTINPTTIDPSTMVPTTNIPTTIVPTSMRPTTTNPTTNIPTTMVPTSIRPTTTNPTTNNPTTMLPTQTITTSSESTSESTATLTQTITTSPESTISELTTTNPTTATPTTSTPTLNTRSTILVGRSILIEVTTMIKGRNVTTQWVKKREDRFKRLFLKVLGLEESEGVQIEIIIGNNQRRKMQDENEGGVTIGFQVIIDDQTDYNTFQTATSDSEQLTNSFAEALNEEYEGITVDPMVVEKEEYVNTDSRTKGTEDHTTTYIVLFCGIGIVICIVILIIYWKFCKLSKHSDLKVEEKQMTTIQMDKKQKTKNEKEGETEIENKTTTEPVVVSPKTPLMLDDQFGNAFSSVVTKK